MIFKHNPPSPFPYRHSDKMEQYNKNPPSVPDPHPVHKHDTDDDVMMTSANGSKVDFVFSSRQVVPMHTTCNMQIYSNTSSYI